MRTVELTIHSRMWNFALGCGNLVTYVAPNSSASKAGVTPGCKLYAIGRRIVKNRTLPDCIKMLDSQARPITVAFQKRSRSPLTERPRNQSGATTTQHRQLGPRNVERSRNDRRSSSIPQERTKRPRQVENVERAKRLAPNPSARSHKRKKIDPERRPAVVSAHSAPVVEAKPIPQRNARSPGQPISLSERNDQEEEDLVILESVSCSPSPSADDDDTNHEIERPQSEEDVRIREIFDVFDRDGDGYINADELSYVLSLVGQKVQPNDANNLLAALGSAGRMSYKQFRRFVDQNNIQKSRNSQEVLQQIFHCLDKDKDGRISLAAFMRFTKYLYNLNDDQTVRMLKSTTRDLNSQLGVSDMKITLSQFRAFFNRHGRKKTL